MSGHDSSGITFGTPSPVSTVRSSPAKAPVLQRGRTFRICPRYSTATVLSSGSCGAVGKALDRCTNRMVAIKKIVNIELEHSMAVHALREIRCLLLLRHTNIVCLEEVIGDTGNLTEVYLQMELMDCDLFDCIRDRHTIMTESEKKQCMFQLLNAIHFMHSAGIVHRDIKPANILVKKEQRIFKIADFDYARKFENSGMPDLLTGIVTTSPYRPPEVALLPAEYAFPVDMWSVGCVMYQLFEKYCFIEGSMNHFEHIGQVLTKMGRATEADTEFILDPLVKQIVFEINKAPKVPWTVLAPRATPQAIKLLDGLMQFNPDKRLTAVQALNSDFVADLRPEGYTEPMYTGPALQDYARRMSYTDVVDTLRQCISHDLEHDECRDEDE